MNPTDQRSTMHNGDSYEHLNELSYSTQHVTELLVILNNAVFFQCIFGRSIIYQFGSKM